MSNEGEESNAVERLAREGLPQLLLGPAGRAISRLVGAAADVPAAWLEARAQSIRDETEARSLVMRTLSEKSAELGLSDPALLDRGLNKLLGQVYREQQNREEVAKVAVENLAADPPTDPVEPSEDWFARFEDAAARASSDDLRQLFGRILAGEVRRPSTFSLATLHHASLIDQPTAAVIRKVVPLVIGQKHVVAQHMRKFLAPDELLLLEEMGFLTIPGDFLTVSMPIGPEGYATLVNRGHGFRAWLPSTAGSALRIEAYVLTRPGQELASIVEAELDVAVFAEVLKAAGFERVEVGPLMTRDGGQYVDAWHSV